jgi:uncharacterized protein
MVIDFHNHLGIDLGAELAQNADELLSRMDEAAIERAVVFPFPGCPSLAEGNSVVRAGTARHPDRFIPFLGFNPREHYGKSETEIAKYLTENGARGVIIDPAMHHFSVRHTIVDPLMAACAILCVPIVVHLVGHGQDDCSPLVELAARYPKVNVVVSPLVYCPGWQALATAQANLYTDTAKLMHPQHIVQLVTVLGVHRVLFGSETPYMCPLVEREKLRYTSLASEMLEQVLHGNAERLLMYAQPTLSL